MGHWHEECGSKEHDETKFEWENFILAPGRGRGGGRGGCGFGGRRAEEEDDLSGGGRGGHRGTGRGHGRNVPPPPTARNDGTVATSWHFNVVCQEGVNLGEPIDGDPSSGGFTGQNSGNLA